MKSFITLIAVCLFLISNGQQIKSKSSSRWEPIYFLDSVKINMLQLYFDQNKIANINVLNKYYDTEKQVHGKIFITSKHPKSYNFLSLHDIINTYVENGKIPVVFLINNEFLKDTTDCKIDSSYILKVEVLKGSEVEYLKSTLPNLLIVKILTKTKENLEKQNRIKIRGTETVLH